VRLRALLVLTLIAACSSFESSDPTPGLPERDASVADDAAVDAGANDAEVSDVAVDATPSASAVYEAAVLADAPKAYWRFTEPVGSAGLASKVGSEYSLLPAPNAPVFGRPGLFSGTGGAIEFASLAGERVETSALPVFAPGPFAVELWLFLDRPGNLNGRSFVVHSTGTASYFAYLQGSTVVVDTTNPNVKRRIVGTGVTDNAWHHLVFQADVGSLSTAEVYVDGIKALDATNLAEGAYPKRPFTLGAADPTTQTIGPGTKLAEVAVYDHVLPAARIADHNLLGKVP
jgi:hypothetical protein